MRYLLDTDTCIYILNGPTPLLRTRFEKENVASLAVSTLTEAELYYGALHSAKPEENRKRVEILISPFSRIPFDSEAAALFAPLKEDLIRRGKPIGVIDMLIASIAKSRGLTLVTNNLRHFQEIPGLSVENWV